MRYDVVAKALYNVFGEKKHCHGINYKESILLLMLTYLNVTTRNINGTGQSKSQSSESVADSEKTGKSKFIVSCAAKVNVFLKNQRERS